jgi:hypothetical protein
MALWPTNYPYSQAPKVNPQQQPENGIGRTETTKDRPSSQVNPSSQNQHQHGGEYASDISILGIKPGEWLIGIVTWLLWLATVNLVREAENTGKRQLRAYVHVGDFGWKAFKMTGAPWGFDTGWGFWLPFENFGTTPARNVTFHISYDTFLPFEGDLPREFSAAPIADLYPGAGLIGPKGKMRSDRLEIYSNILDAAAVGQIRLFIWGYVAYNDVFEGTPQRRTECFELDKVDGDPYLIPETQDSPDIFFHFRTCGRYNRVDEDCDKEYS